MQLCFEKNGNGFLEIEKEQGIFAMYPGIDQRTVRAKKLVVTTEKEKMSLHGRHVQQILVQRQKK